MFDSPPSAPAPPAEICNPTTVTKVSGGVNLDAQHDAIGSGKTTTNIDTGGRASIAGDVKVADGGEFVGHDKIVNIDEAPAPIASGRRGTPPAPPAHFTGREATLERFVQLLTSSEDSATLALQGMGGIGKTALALKLAERLQGACDASNRLYFPGGVLWWRLGPSPNVITALDVWARYADPRSDLKDFPDPQARAAVVRSMLAELGKLCVIVDDVWDAEPFNVLKSAVPPGCPILITTRNGDLAKSLRCRVEHIGALKDAEALALLAKLLGPLNGQAGAAREIAHLTEGLPLALELIAGLADAPADLPALAKQLRSKPTLDVLKRGPTREQSIEVCFTMSYERLDADMQRRFRALGVFAPAPFERDAIAAVWDEDGDEVDDAIRFLVRRSLLSKDEMTQDYTLHTLLHDYASKLLHTPLRVREADETRENATDEQRGGVAEGLRHADYYRRFAKEEDWRSVEYAFDQIDWGWRWVRANVPDQIIRYMFAVQHFLDTRGRKLELLNWYQVGLTEVRAVKDRKNEGPLLNNLGSVYDGLGHQEQALAFYQQALAIFREVGDRSGEGGTLNNLGNVYSALGQMEKALAFYQQALAIHGEVGKRSMEGTTLHSLGRAYDDLGQKEQALAFYQQALAIHREAGNRSMEGTTLHNLGRAYDDLDQKEKALAFYQQALAIFREVGDRSGEGGILNNLGNVYSTLGQKEQALAFYHQALAIFREVGDRWGESATLYNIGCLLDAIGRTAEAVAYLKQNVAVDEAIGHLDLERDRATLERVRQKLNRRPSRSHKLRGT